MQMCKYGNLKNAISQISLIVFNKKKTNNIFTIKFLFASMQ